MTFTAYLAAQARADTAAEAVALAYARLQAARSGPGGVSLEAAAIEGTRREYDAALGVLQRANDALSRAQRERAA